MKIISNTSSPNDVKVLDSNGKDILDELNVESIRIDICVDKSNRVTLVCIVNEIDIVADDIDII